MESDRPHRSNSSCSSTPNTTSELFICFTSRLSSSMKISSKSILSPGRSRDSSQISLSTSLSRRLRTNGSMRGGQASPMFPTNAKKRGSFETPEPSSPKVTCIGQVRVKTKKQGKKIRSRSQRRSGEISFRRVEQSKSCNLDDDFTHSHPENANPNPFLNHDCNLPPRSQKWVHLPLSICEALRGLGAEFNCFLPCRSSCAASEKDKEEKAAAGGSSNGSNSSSSCGAVFARWLVAVQEGDGKGREIELVVGEEENEVEEEESTERRRSYRRHVFEEIDFKEGGIEVGKDEEEGRVSICIPPKNALLLMRCRSDPVKMAALANKFWEPPLPNDEDKEEDEEEAEKEEKIGTLTEKEQKIHDFREKEEEINDVTEEKLGSCDTVEENQIEEAQDVITEEPDSMQQQEQKEIPLENENPEEIEENAVKQCEEQEESNLSDDSVHMELPLQSFEPILKENGLTEQELNEETLIHERSERQLPVEEFKDQEEAIGNEEETLTHERSEPEGNLKTGEGGQTGIKSKERDNPPLLPDCLLLMMCEPKLSMEVSKETWVCSTDFIRWLPEPSRPPAKKKIAAGGGDDGKKRNSVDIHPPPVRQPPRSSCSYPARAAGAESISTAVEKKMAGSKGCEPFKLKRCKSEPMRTAAKLAPENCFWKSRKLEPHCPATLGVGAAGVGC